MPKLKKRIRREIKRAKTFPNSVPALVAYYERLGFKSLDGEEMSRYVETAYRVIRNVPDSEEIDIPARISMDAFVLINEAVWMLEGEGLINRFKKEGR